MNIQVLISTMNQIDIESLVKDMRVKSAVVINQVTKNITLPMDIRGDSLTSFSVKERGLSKSRNMAIKNAKADICLIADDDMYYVKDYEQIVSNAYAKYPQADIITFYVDHEDPTQAARIQRGGKVSLLKTMKTVSYQISFRRESITKCDLRMDERFGTGTDLYMGEENIFLFDACRKGLKVYHVPLKIATLKKDSISTWFTGYDERYFVVKGSVFYRMYPRLSTILLLQFILRKSSQYSSSIAPGRAIFSGFTGIINQKRTGN